MEIKKLFKKNDKPIQEVEAPVIETKTQEPTKLILEVSRDELILIGKALETSENTELFYRVREGSSNNDLLTRVVEKIPKE